MSQSVVLVVRMSRNLQESTGDSEFSQREPEGNVAGVLGDQGEIHPVLRHKPFTRRLRVHAHVCR